MMSSIRLPGPSLTKEQEEEVIKQYLETRDIKLRNKLVSQYYRLTFSLIKKYASGYPEHFDDLVSTAAFGMMRAVEKYSPEKGKLSHYVGIWIRASIYSYITKNTFATKVPFCTEFRKLFLSARKENFNDLTAKELGVSENKLKFFKEALHNKFPVYLDDDNCDETSNHELIPNHERSQDDLTMAKEEYENFMEELSGLSEREQFIFKGRFFEEKTLEQVGQDLGGLSRERVRQLETKILKELRA